MDTINNDMQEQPVSEASVNVPSLERYRARGRKGRDSGEDFSKNSTIYQSMKRLCVDKNLPIALIRAAKNAGAPGFAANGRLDWAIIQPWLAEHADELQVESDETLTVWKTRLTKAQAQKAELELDRTKGNYLLKSEVMETIQAIATGQKNLLKTRLVQELPPKLYGLKVDEIIGIMEGVVGEICSLMQNAKF